MDQLGPYRLRKRLAVGGMGEVYLGEKLGPENFVKPVVLKCVLPQLAKDRAFVQLFLDEARLAALKATVRHSACCSRRAARCCLVHRATARR